MPRAPSSRVALVALAAACGGNGGGADAGPGTADAVAPRIDAFAGDPLIDIGAVELVDDGYLFTEGPQWREAEADLVFSDIDGNTIYRYQPGGGAPVPLRAPSGNANGNAVDAAGALLSAEHGSRSVTRTTATGTTTVFADFEGSSLNSPNDVVVAADGTIYFTDPPYGISAAERELDFMGVFRGAGAALSAEHRGALSERPNGIALSADGTRVYVADTADGNVYAFAIGAGGALAPRVVLAATAGNPDGLAIDAAGNLFVTTVDGVEVFAPDGTRWGVIDVPMQPANCAFGDADHRTLYITARSAVYRVRLAHPGLPTH
jgi:gluconolactonase